MDKSSASQCLLCFEQITSILSEIVVNDYVYSVRDMLHFFSTKLDESVPQDDTVLCESCAMELSTAFDFLLKIQKAEEAVEKKAQKAHKVPEAEEVLDLTEPENDFNIDAFIEKVPQPAMEEKPPTPPPAKKPKISLKTKLPEQLDDDIEYPSRVVIFPQFVVCPAEPKKLMEDVAAGRISEEFLQRRNRLKMLDVTGVMVSLENYHRGTLKPEVIQTDQHKEDMYLCRYCPKSFSTAHHLMMHTRKTHVCQFCLQGFAKLDDLHTHIEQEHDKFECHFCPREFSCNNNLRTHLKKRHGVTLPAYVSLITVEKQAGEEDEPLEAPKG